MLFIQNSQLSDAKKLFDLCLWKIYIQYTTILNNLFINIAIANNRVYLARLFLC